MISISTPSEKGVTLKKKKNAPIESKCVSYRVNHRL